MRCVRVVANGEEMSLRNSFLGGELARVQLIIGEVVVRDTKVLAGGNAKG